MKKLLLLLIAAAFLYPLTASAVTRNAATGSGSTNVSIRLADPAGAVYVEDEPIQLSVRTATEAYVAVFNIDTEGFVHLLYPADSGSFRRMKATRQVEIPASDREAFLVEGKTGIEMVFALAVTDKDELDDLEVSFLMNNANLPKESQYRVDGDPFLAANDIVSRLVRGIDNDADASLAYTYFYVNEAVDFPRYLCADCYANDIDPYAGNMPTYTPTVAFEASSGLSYPLQAGFEELVPVAESTPQPGITYDYDEPVTETHVYVHYPAPRHYYYPTSWYYWDYYWWRPYCAYPAPYRGGFYFSIGWNWGYWGGWGHHYDPYYYGGTVVVDNRPTRGTIRHNRYKGTSGNGTLYDDLYLKNRDRTVARREGMRVKTASASNSRKVAAKTRGKGGGGDTPTIMTRPQTARTKGGSGGPIAQLRPQTARTKSGGDRPVAQLRPQTARTKGGNGGPVIQPRAGGGGGGDVTVRGKRSRTVKPLTRQTRGTFSNKDRRTYDPRSKSKPGTRPSIQSRADRTKSLKSRGTTRSTSKYRSSAKTRSSRSVKSSKGSSSSSSKKSLSVSRPSSRSSSKSSVSKGSSRSGSRSSGKARSSSRSKGKK